MYSPSQPFSYIHQRSMAGSIPNWTQLYEQALQHLCPGGWIEAQEFDVWFYSQTPQGLGEDSAIMKWQKLIDEASIGIGSRLNCAGMLGTKMEEAGFVGVRSQVIKVGIFYILIKSTLFFWWLPSFPF
jgi:Methyltransferase domain